MSEEYRAVVIGTSAGGMTALTTILAMLPEDFTLSVIIVQHILEEGMDGYRTGFLDKRCALPVKEAMDKEPLQPGTVYLAPAGYHLLLEQAGTLSLSVDAPVNFSRPSIDVLFESAAVALGARLVGIILTGANSDGSQGIKKIKECRGYVIVQDPAEAEVPAMPLAAIESTEIDQILPLARIGSFLAEHGAQAVRKTKTPPLNQKNSRVDANGSV